MISTVETMSNLDEIFGEGFEKSLTSTDKQLGQVNKVHAAIFLGSVAGIAILGGFGSAFASVKKNNPKVFDNVHSEAAIHEEAVRLACRALGRGSLYAVVFCSCFTYGIWKMSGAKTMEEFRHKAGSILPKLSK